MLTGKKIVLGVSGGIAAYKMANVASMLSKLHADIHVVMTENATHFITPETFEVLTGNHCYTDTFDRCMELHVPHIALGTQADAILIAPASADVVGKIANGIADDMLTTCVLPATCPVMLAPSMNVHMYENPIVQDNMPLMDMRSSRLTKDIWHAGISAKESFRRSMCLWIILSVPAQWTKTLQARKCL